MFDNTFLNENKYFLGIIMILVNIGSRFIIGELSDNHKKFINNHIIRKIFIFCVIFMATRDISTSIILTVFIVFLISELLNENSDISLIKNDNEDKDEDEEDIKSMSKIDIDKKLQDTIDELYTIKNKIA
jgi:hypothetical protein